MAGLGLTAGRLETTSKPLDLSRCDFHGRVADDGSVSHTTTAHDALAQILTKAATGTGTKSGLNPGRPRVRTQPIQEQRI